MGVGFIITIVALSALLGLFARQTLAVSDELEGEYTEEEPPHSTAM